MRFFAAALIFFGVAASYAQTPEVPHKIHFAGMSLTIRDDARREIQKDVDALTRHKRYFEMYAERARTYFPIIEKIFKEEELPDDFKYLALQESSLTPDAVSVSNAVGFWQFKDYTAQEMGLRVDGQIDERMNIVSSTRGAARYLKLSNNRFDNWLLALQSYQMGAGGVERALGDKYNGHSHMEVTSETYWYVKKFLAHKIAFADACQGPAKLKAGLYETRTERQLSDIAREVEVEEMLLKEYNKWVRRDAIPSDKPYFLFIPGGTASADFSNLVLTSDKASKAIPLVKKSQPGDVRAVINGVAAVKANPGESINELAARAGLDVSRFIRYNEISIDEAVRPGVFYFLKKKKKKNQSGTYKARMGDDLWAVSQKFGVRLSSLHKLNASVNDQLLASGTIIRLNSEAAITPPQQAVETPVVVDVAPSEVAALSNDTFNWGAQPETKQTIAEIKTEPAVPNVTIDSLAESRAEIVQSPSRDSTFQHIVKKGETLYSIAHLYNLEVSKLIKDNQLNLGNPLMPGQTISVNKTPMFSGNDVEQASIKKAASTEGDSFVYEVKSTDTLYGIARQFGATIKELMDWNNKSTLTVSTGEKLKILKR